MLPKITKTDVPIIDAMTKEELLDYILDNLKEYYDKTDVSSYIKYAAHAKTAQFYKGIERGLWECQRIVNEIKGRLAVEQEDNE
jgi:hypothetical protein